MEKISSRQTFFVKRAFPALWFGFLMFFAILAAFAGDVAKDPAILAVPLVMAAVGFFIFRFLAWDLMDEVLEGEDFLLVRRGGAEERMQLSSVMSVSISLFINPARISLRLRNPGKFGDKISFIPKMSTRLFHPFGRNETMQRLINKIDRLRNR